MSIVLVIIGLIVGGMLVGQSLISAAAARAQVTQIEKYNQAVNTFYGKYGYLPGDIPPVNAVQVGLSPSVASRTYGSNSFGNGDGVIATVSGGPEGLGNGQEFYFFWEDLLTAGLIADPLLTLTGTTHPCTAGGGFCVVSARIGQGNAVYVYSGGNDDGGTGSWVSTNINYWGLSVPVEEDSGFAISNPGLTVSQAQAIDQKIDDGMPITGRVIAAYINGPPNSSLATNGYGEGWGAPVWVNPGSSIYDVAPGGSGIQGTSATCYDNGNSAANAIQYSMEQSNGTGVNCALSFRMQAGD